MISPNRPITTILYGYRSQKFLSSQKIRGVQMITKPTLETCLYIQQLNIPIGDKPAGWKLYYAAKVGAEQSTIPAIANPAKWKLFHAANQGRSGDDTDKL